MIMVKGSESLELGGRLFNQETMRTN